MQDNYFDRIIRTKLLDLELSLDSSDWAYMTARLDAAFDADLAEKLSSAYVAYEPADWEVMDKKLSSEVFDEGIREQLADHTIAYQAGDWDVLNEKLDQPFDALIREQLQDHQVAYQEADWALITEQLDQPFDASIREVFQDHTINYDPKDWDAIGEKLDQNFDEAVREQLEEYEVAYQSQDWDVMVAAMPLPFDMAIESKLSGLTYDAFDSDWNHMQTQLDQDFDKTVRDQLATHELPLEAADWQVMDGLLQAGRVAWFDRIIPYVDAFVILLLIALWHFPQQSLPQLAPVDIDILASDMSSALTRSVKSEPQVIPLSPVFSLNEESESSYASQQTAAIQEIESHITPFQKGNLGKVHVQQGAYTRGMNQGSDKQTFSNNLPPTSDKQLFPIAIVPTSLNAHVAVPTFEKVNKVTQALHIRVGISSSVFSSAAEFNDNGIWGALAGVRLELPINEHLSFVSGLQYGEKGFDRLILNVTKSNNILTREPTYWVSRLKGEIQMLEIPIYLRYRFKPHERIGLYFQGGLSAAVTLDERYWNYDPRAVSNISQMQTRTDIDFTRPQNNPALEAYLEGIQPKISTHTLNTYIGFLQIAPGVEVALGSKLYLQAEPYIQLGLQRLGSERQRLHSLGGTLSLSYQLGSH